MFEASKFGLEAIVVIFLSLPAFGSHAADYAVPAGRYSIESQMVLPHMEEMRRIHKRVDACVGPGEVARLFPVFNQPALTGCALLHTISDKETAYFQLECAGVNGASGNASLNLEGERIHGTLIAKMGGKNMTFSQIVNAQRRGSCTH